MSDDGLIPMGRFEYEKVVRRTQFPKGRGVRPTTLCLLALTVATYADTKTGKKAFPGNEKLALTCQISRKQVGRGLEILRDLGLLRLHKAHSGPGRDGGAGKAAEYHLTIPEDLSKLTLLDPEEHVVQDPESLLPPFPPEDESRDITDESRDITAEIKGHLNVPSPHQLHLYNSSYQPGSPNVTVTSAREAESPLDVAARNDEMAAVYRESSGLLQDAPLCGQPYMEEVKRTQPELTLTEQVIAAADLFRMDLESARPAFRPEKRESA